MKTNTFKIAVSIFLLLPIFIGSALAEPADSASADAFRVGVIGPFDNDHMSYFAVPYQNGIKLALRLPPSYDAAHSW